MSDVLKIAMTPEVISGVPEHPAENQITSGAAVGQLKLSSYNFSDPERFSVYIMQNITFQFGQNIGRQAGRAARPAQLDQVGRLDIVDHLQSHD